MIFASPLFAQIAATREPTNGYPWGIVEPSLEPLPVPPPSHPDRWSAWIEARRRYGLSHAQIQMARELGMNPLHLEGLAGRHVDAWKASLPQFIENLYWKNFGRKSPTEVLSIEQMVRQDQSLRASGRP